MIQSRALTRLIKDLLHPDASKRRSAAEELSQADERAVYPLIKALRDENPGVQDAAMRSLISIGGETSAYMVLPLLREDSYLRNTAIIILKDIGAAAVPLLYPLLKDKDEDIRKFSVDLLMDIREGVSPEKISPLLHDPNPNVRASAAKAAGALGYRDAVPDLLQALHDDEWVCFSALEALGELKEETTAGAVAGLLSGSPGPVRYAAVEALGKIGSPRSVTALREHLDKADDLEKASVVKGLLQLGAAHSVPGVTGILVEMLENSGWEDKIISLKGIAELKACETIKSILDVGGSLDPSDPESEERLEVIRETLRSLACTHAFIDALDDPDIRYRGRVIAVDVIGDLRCEKAVPLLLRLLESDVRDVRRACVRALGEIDCEETREALLCAVDDYDSHVRRAAVDALGKIAAEEAFGPVMHLLRKEQYPDVMEAAVGALFAINREKFLSRLEEFGEPVRAVADWFQAR